MSFIDERAGLPCPLEGVGLADRRVRAGLPIDLRRGVLDIGSSNGFASGNVKGPMTSSLITPHLVPRHVTFNGAHGQKENLSKASVPRRILGGLGPWGGRSSGLLGPLRQCHYAGCSYQCAPMSRWSWGKSARDAQGGAVSPVLGGCSVAVNKKAVLAAVWCKVCRTVVEHV